MFFAVSGRQLEPILPQHFLAWHIPITHDPKSKYFENSEIISIKPTKQETFSAAIRAAIIETLEDVDHSDKVEIKIKIMQK